MLKVLFCVLVLGSSSIYAQVISGGNGEIKDPFEFKIMSKAPSSNYGDSTGILTDKNSMTSDIICLDDFYKILYRNKNDERKDFKFSNTDNCSVVLACVKSLKKGEFIKILINRGDNTIKEVVLPASCSIDSWAYEGDIEQKVNV